jgi:hypothetical protein
VSTRTDNEKSEPREPGPLTAAERDRLAKDVVALVAAGDAAHAEAADVAADVGHLLGGLTAEDARLVFDDIETRLRVRRLYDQFRSYYETSRRVARRLRALDKDLVELARASEMFRPDASEDIALFHAALERAQGGATRAGIAQAFADAEPQAELEFITYLATHAEADREKPRRDR